MMSGVLILIDVQEAFHEPCWGERYGPHAEQNIERLLNYFRSEHQPIIHIKHVSQDPSSLFHREHLQGLIYEAKIDEIIIEKEMNSAFIGTTLSTILRSHGWYHLTIAGISLPHCVSTTTRMAQNLGFTVDLIEDATVSFELKDLDGNQLNAQDVHTYNIASLNHEFAYLYSTEDYLKDRSYKKD